MGTTRFSGPVYGAKAVLFAASVASLATAQSAVEMFEIDVPATEDWLFCEATLYCTAAGSAAAAVSIKDDGTTVGSAMTAIVNDSVGQTFTPSSGEDEGLVVAASSNVTVVVATGTTTGPSNVMVAVYGYRRSLNY